MVGALQEAVSPAGQPIPNVHRQQAFPAQRIIASVEHALTVTTAKIIYALFVNKLRPRWQHFTRPYVQSVYSALHEGLLQGRH